MAPGAYTLPALMNHKVVNTVTSTICVRLETSGTEGTFSRLHPVLLQPLKSSGERGVLNGRRARGAGNAEVGKGVYVLFRGSIVISNS